MQNTINTMITKIIAGKNIDTEIIHIARNANNIKDAKNLISNIRDITEDRRVVAADLYNIIFDALEGANREVRPVFLETKGIRDTLPCLIGKVNDGTFTSYYSARLNIKVEISDVTDIHYTKHTDNTSHLEGIAHIIS